MNNLQKLLKRAENLGWYGGVPVLVRIELKGAFEGWTVRATETWEHRYFVSSDEVKENGKVVWPCFTIDGENLEEVCGRALDIVANQSKV